MDIFLQGEWFEFRFLSGRILKLKLTPIPYEEYIKWSKENPGAYYDHLFEHIIDWEGLSKNGEKIEPTQENVKLYMRYFITAKVERIGKPIPVGPVESGPVDEEEKKKEFPILGFQLGEILQNIEEFLGN